METVRITLEFASVAAAREATQAPSAPSPAAPDPGSSKPRSLDTEGVRKAGDVGDCPPAWQGVTREEHENSFIGQWGVYTLSRHDGGWTPSRWVGSNGSCVMVDDRGVLTAIGGNDTSTPPDDIKHYLQRNTPVAMYANTTHTAALVNDACSGSGRLMIWRGPLPVRDKTLHLSHVRSVYAASNAMVLLYDTPMDGRWLDVVGGAVTSVVPDNLHVSLANDPPVSVRVTEQAFAVLTGKGRVYAWGAATHGGAIPEATADQMKPFVIARIFANSVAFCALTRDGMVFTWGGASGGGNPGADVIGNIMDDGGASTIVAAQSAFTAITRESARAISWGAPALGGQMTAMAAEVAVRGGIVACKAATSAFCIVSSSGSLASWGAAAKGGQFNASSTPISNVDSPNPVDIDFMERELRRVRLGAVVTSDDASYVGGTHTTDEGSIQICAAENAFSLITTDADRCIRSIHAWGENSVLSESTRQALLGSKLERIIEGNSVFVAIVTQGETRGCLLGWGAAHSLPPKTPYDTVASPVDDIHAINALPTAYPTATGFATRHMDGTRVIWGIGTAPIVIPAPSVV